ncbi:MAG: hypothetical protein Q7N50_09950 [Armatimonadota bacterium]|nr:hypothetical protein [Armatimonadota bacterium]
MDFETPREAMLRAENTRLRSEVEYLRRAVDSTGELKFTPVSVIEERIMNPLLPAISLPVVASIQGNLFRYGDYHVLARLSHTQAQPEDLMVQYHAPAHAIKGNADYFVNELFPFLHQRFISALANAIRKPKQEVA